jgi:hypothetical protein
MEKGLLGKKSGKGFFEYVFVVVVVLASPSLLQPSHISMIPINQIN